jgi:hypothetical protein
MQKAWAAWGNFGIIFFPILPKKLGAFWRIPEKCPKDSANIFFPGC